MARVIVSAGHTNNDPGTIVGDLREVDLNRTIAKKIVAQLRGNGIITLSVPPNMDLQKRIEWINGTGYKSEFDDIAIEIHVNDGGKTGFEFWYEGEGKNASENLAQSIMQKVTERTGLSSQGVKSETEHEYKSLAFLNKTNTISALLECLYIDNDNDLKKLKDDNELNNIAKGIAEGVCSYLNIQYTEIEVPQGNAQTSPSSKNQAIPSRNTSSAQPQNIDQQNRSRQNIPQRPATNVQTNMQGSTQNYNYPPQIRESGTINNNLQQSQMTREERREMIVSYYKKILGREPNQNDLNYFLNIGITEDKLLKRMIDSQEHLDIIGAKKEFEHNKEIFEKQKIELSRLKAENNDQKVLLHNLSKLLHQKNKHISEMKVRLDKYETKKGFNSSTKEESKKSDYKGSITERFFHFLSTFLG